MHQPKIQPRQKQFATSDRLPTKVNSVGANSTARRHQKVRQFPRQNSIPNWLRALLNLQKGAKLLWGGMFGLSLLAYGCTVHTQNTWKQQHGQLKQLQDRERKQSEMNENIKNQLAEAAEQPQSQLVEPDPNRSIFIPSATQRPIKSTAKTTSAKTVIDSPPPSGY